MKKINKLLLITAALVCILATTAFASNYDSAAQEMKEIGLFQGSDTGFELDRAPTRTEAAVMLVRLLGAENKAKTEFTAGKISHPFTDVPDWANPYIAWLYTNKLTSGVSDTMFGANGRCTDKMYCTFVLRALGYSDANGDFTFDSSDTFAEKAGIYSSKLVEDTFLRDDAVAISYQALATSLKNSDKSLLEKLISDGVVSEKSASALLTKVKAYRAYCAAYKKMNEVSAISATINQSLNMVGAKSTAGYVMDIKTTQKGILTENDLKLESISVVNNSGNSVTTSVWISGGYLYQKSGSTKVKMALTEELKNQLFSADTSFQMPALYNIKSITTTSTNDGTQYKIIFSNSSNYLSTLNLGINFSGISNLSGTNCSLTATVGSNGMLSSLSNDYTCTFTDNLTGEAEPVNFHYTYDETITATGSSVVIDFPDFSGYVKY